jgi:hypothetical protein
MKTPLLLLLLALTLSPLGYAQPVKVTVVPVESMEDFKRWLGTPVDSARAASPTTYPGRLSALPVGKKTQLPILVTGLPVPAANGTRYQADVQVLGTDGKSLGIAPRCCEAIVAKGSNERAVLLNSAVIVEPEVGQRNGNYTVNVLVTDGASSWRASEVMPYGETDMPGTHEVPRLRMNVPPAQLEPGGPGDKRDCLSLPTPAEVIKCAESSSPRRRGSN